MTRRAPRLRTPWFAAAAIIAITGLAYSNSFSGGFVGLDAKESIRDNSHIRRLWPLSEAMSLSLLDSTLEADEGSKGGTVVRRPILSLSFALTYRAFGADPWGFHAVNLAIHIATALVLFGIVRRTLWAQRSAVDDEMAATWLALAVALIWAVHPLGTESVTYIVQRAESLMGLFLALTLYCAIRGFRNAYAWQWYAGAILAAALGMGTKETMVVAPLIVLVYDYVFVSPTVKDLLGRHWRVYLGLAATWIIPAVLVWTTLADASQDFEAGRALPYILAQARVLLYYVWLAYWPHPLFVYVNTHSFEVQPGFTPMLQYVVPATLVTVSLVLTAWAVLRRRAIGFLGAWFFLILAPSSSVVATSDLIQEHRMYLPLVAVVAMAVFAAYGILKKVPGARQRGVLAATLGTAVIACLGVRTYQRNEAYRSEFSMIYPGDLQEAYTILADHHESHGTLEAEADTARAVLASAAPAAADVAYAHFVLGAQYAAKKDSTPAVEHFERVIELQPDQAHAHLRVADVLQHRGASVPAIEHLERAVALRPFFADARNELGVALAQQDHSQRAAEQFEWAIRLRPDFAEAHNEFGMLLKREGDESGATEHFARAVEILERKLRMQPRLASAQNELGIFLMQQGARERAIEHFQQAIQLRPNFAEAHQELGNALRDRRDLKGAAEQFATAARLRPDFAEAHNELGWVLLEQGNAAAAAEEFARALTIQPDFPEADCNLAVALVRQGRLAEAASRIQALEQNHRALPELQERLEAVRAMLGERAS